MDATIFWEGSGVWHVLTSPTMRSLGDVIRQADGSLTIEADVGSDIDGMVLGPYGNLEDVMSAIAAHLGGRCTTQRKGARAR